MTTTTDRTGPLRRLALGDAPALARLARDNRDFLAPTSPVRPDEWFTDEGQEAEEAPPAEEGPGLPLPEAGPVRESPQVIGHHLTQLFQPVGWAVEYQQGQGASHIADRRPGQHWQRGYGGREGGGAGGGHAGGVIASGEGPHRPRDDGEEAVQDFRPRESAG